VAAVAVTGVSIGAVNAAANAGAKGAGLQDQNRFWAEYGGRTDTAGFVSMLE
jgi:hypothetical protein